MGFLLQITMSCPCALSRQVAGAGAVSLRVWRQVAGAGCWVPVLVLWAGCARGGDRLLVPVLELAVHVVETGCWCWCCELAVPGGGAGAARGGGWCWCRVPVLVLGAGCRCWCWVLLWSCRKLAVQAAYILFQPVA